MSFFLAGSPRITKGAIVSFDLNNPIPQVILFQYNPESLTRSLQAQSTGGGEGDRAEAFRLKGPPIETISLDIELDASDQLEHPDRNPIAAKMGIHPQLAALELILYPKSQLIISSILREALGIMEVKPEEGPFTLFIWGNNRVVPVRLTDFQVTEEAYDTNLNPIRAKVSLSLRVLSYDDLERTHPGHSLYLVYQTAKEAMGILGTVNSLAAAGESIRFF
jgi:Contractile injection system tube protein